VLVDSFIIFSCNDMLFGAEVIMFSGEHKLLSDTVIVLSSDDILFGGTIIMFS